MAESKSNLDNSKASLPSNEELINTLVSGIKECLAETDSSGQRVNQDVQSESEKTLPSPNNNSGYIAQDETKGIPHEGEDLKKTCGSDSEKTVPLLDDDGDLTDEAKEIPSVEDDLVDELALKDREMTLSEEDRERLHKEAETLKQNGNELFKAAQYRESVESYTQALRTCPLTYPKDRAVFYANRAAAKMKLELNESAVEDCSRALELDERYLKALFRRAQLYELTDKLDEALADYHKILEIDPLHRDALYASKRLPDQIQERNEKLKNEMFGKLKDLGNMILKPFGLSTENFQLSQDPNSGGYSVNFKS